MDRTEKPCRFCDSTEHSSSGHTRYNAAYGGRTREEIAQLEAEATAMDRTEVEAVARAIAGWDPSSATPVNDAECAAAKRAISALDAVRRSPQDEDHETLKAHADALAAWVETLCEQVTSTPALMEVERYRSHLSHCPSPERRKYVVDWTEAGDGILLDMRTDPATVIGTHDLPAPSPERDTERRA